ncbi:hypothetical protein LCGC14_2155280, partial [marine sediment metagenome]
MSSEKDLIKKKYTQQTISISPALKNKIEKYVIENNQKNPKDKRFKSISAFYNYILEKTMSCFEQGKTLNDFERFVDEEFQEFFDKISFKGFIPYYENALKPNRYTNLTLDNTPRFFLALRKFYKSKFDPYDVKTIKKFFKRLRNYLISNNLTKENTLDLFTRKGSKVLKGVYEYVGIYKNFFFEFCKQTAAFFGILGIKITKFLFSEKDFYYRFDLESTDLFFREDLVKQERIKLIAGNLSFIINYANIIKDDDYYLWMRMAEDKDALICFNNQKTQEEWINLIEEDLKIFGDDDEYLVNILKFFEKLHWVDIDNEEELIFQINLSKSKNLTFAATIPLYEMIAESNRYTYFSFDFNTHFLLTYLNFLRSQFTSQNYEDLKLLFEKIRSRIGNNNISKDVRLEIFPDKDKGLAKGTLEFIGKYKNLHFENCKFLAVILGILGVKVIDFIYSPNDYYCRLDLLATNLLFRKEIMKKERLKLLEENVDFIINYN